MICRCEWRREEDKSSRKGRERKAQSLECGVSTKDTQQLAWRTGAETATPGLRGLKKDFSQKRPIEPATAVPPPRFGSCGFRASARKDTATGRQSRAEFSCCQAIRQRFRRHTRGIGILSAQNANNHVRRELPTNPLTKVQASDRARSDPARGNIYCRKLPSCACHHARRLFKVFHKQG